MWVLNMHLCLIEFGINDPDCDVGFVRRQAITRSDTVLLFLF